MRTPILALLSSTVIAGCFELEPTKGADTTDTADTAAPADSGDTSEAVEEAAVRFVNTVGGSQITFRAESVTDGTTVEQALYQTQGSAYEPFPAGAMNLTFTDADGNEVLSYDGFELAEGRRYSVAYTDAGLFVTLEDMDGIPENHTRVNLFNAQTGGDVAAWIGYWNGDGYEVDYTYTLEDGGAENEDLPFAATAVQLELKWAHLDNLLVDWNIAAFVQVDPDSVVNVYFWTEGDCSYLSSSCETFILGQFADGSTATVEGSFGWAG